MTQAGLIPRKRLRRIPNKYRAAHEYCFFLHDECVRALVEYEKARAHTVSFKFKSKAHAARFGELAAANDPINAMRELGYARQARKLVLSQITMALVSDCLHHIYEALTCIKRRKIVVAFNLLRKPLKDSQLLLSWMLGDENGFYSAFTSGNPEMLSQKRLGNTRKEIFREAIAKIQMSAIFDPETLNEILYDRKSNNSFEPFFQRAVHLITVEHIELRTEAENFNFIFKNYTDPDVDEGIYRWLPYIMLYLSHVIMELFERMRPMDKGIRTAFLVRSLNAYSLATGIRVGETLSELEKAFDGQIRCPHCEKPIKLTRHSGLRVLMTESFRCTHCHRVQPFPFSWIF
jgi:hypothetical protein